MTLQARVRAAGDPLGKGTWLVHLGDLVPTSPAALREIRLAVELVDGDVHPNGCASALPSLSDQDWARIEVDVARLLAPGEQGEAALLARVVAALPWHPRKLRVLRRLEARAFGILTRGVPSEGFATPLAAPPRSKR